MSSDGALCGAPKGTLGCISFANTPLGLSTRPARSGLLFDLKQLYQLVNGCHHGLYVKGLASR